MPAPYHGGCLCGAIRYRLSDEPLTLYACHCTDCQRSSGSAFGLSMIVSRTALDLFQGELQRYAVTMRDGRQKHGTFCGTCATRLWGEPVKFPQVVNIEPGTLDDTSWLRPGCHVWTQHAQPWVKFSHADVVFEQQPSLEEMPRFEGA